MRILLSWLLQLYRYSLSPILGSNCRFYPSCSSYALQAIEQHGSVHGCCLTARRLWRCHPWNPGGYDPVPAPSSCPTRSSNG